MRVDTVSPGNRFAAHRWPQRITCFKLGPPKRIAHVTYGTRLIGQHRKFGFLDAYRASAHSYAPRRDHRRRYV